MSNETGRDAHSVPLPPATTGAPPVSTAGDRPGRRWGILPPFVHGARGAAPDAPRRASDHGEPDTATDVDEPFEAAAEPPDTGWEPYASDPGAETVEPPTWFDEPARRGPVFSFDDDVLPESETAPPVSAADEPWSFTAGEEPGAAAAYATPDASTDEPLNAEPWAGPADEPSNAEPWAGPADEPSNAEPWAGPPDTPQEAPPPSGELWTLAERSEPWGAGEEEPWSEAPPAGREAEPWSAPESAPDEAPAAADPWDAPAPWEATAAWDDDVASADAGSDRIDPWDAAPLEPQPDDDSWPATQPATGGTPTGALPEAFFADAFYTPRMMEQTEAGAAQDAERIVAQQVAERLADLSRQIRERGFSALTENVDPDQLSRIIAGMVAGFVTRSELDE